MRVKQLLSRWLILLALVQLTAIPASVDNVLLRWRFHCPPDEILITLHNLETIGISHATRHEKVKERSCIESTSWSFSEIDYYPSFHIDRSWIFRTPRSILWLLSFVLWKFATTYVWLLESRPVFTKSSTAAVIGAFGDILAQAFEQSSCCQDARNADKDRKRAFNMRRTFSSAAEGLFVSGPLMHYSYQYLEALVPVNAESNHFAMKWIATIVQVAVDALIMDPVFVGTMLVVPAVLEGRSHDIPNFLRSSYIRGVKASWVSSAFFSPLQCVAFRYLRLEFRVLAMNVQDIAWEALISYIGHDEQWNTESVY